MISSEQHPPFERPSTLPEEWGALVRSQVTRLDELAAENSALKEQELQQAETIRELRDEIAVLKGQKGRPVIKPSRMDKGTDPDEPPGDKGRGKGTVSGKAAIHEERTIRAVGVPAGSRFLGHRAFTVQDLRITAHNTRFLRERWATPDGQVVTANGSQELAGLHFGPALRAFRLYQPPLPCDAAETARTAAGMGPEPLGRPNQWVAGVRPRDLRGREIQSAEDGTGDPFRHHGG